MPNDNTLFIEGLDDVNEQPKKPTRPTPDAVKKMKEKLGLVQQSESDDLQTINSEISSLSGKVKEYEALDSQKNNSQSKTYGMYSGGMSVLDAVKPVKEVNDKYAELGKNISRDRERLAELNRKRDEIIKAQVSPLKDAIKQKRAELEQEYAEVIPIGQNIERQMRSGGLTFDDYYNIKEFDRGFLNLNTKTKEQSDLENRARTPYKEFITKKKALDISEQYLNKLEKEADISPDNYLKALGQGFANHDWIDLATLGAKSMAENFNLAEISKKVKNGTASEEEKTALTLYDQFNQLASTKDKPITYDIAQSFIQSLPYMADIAISGGVRSAITKGVTKGIGRTVIGLSDNVAGAIANKTAQKVTTGAIKNTAKIATQAAGAIASSPLQVNMYSNIARNELDNYVIGYDDNGEINVREAKDFKNGFQNTMRALMTTASATFSESSGKVFDDSFAMLGKKFGLGKINNRYINDLSKKFAEIKKATNVQGTLGETFEEYVNKFTDNIVTDPREEEGRDEWANFFDTREGLTIIGSTILTQAMFGVGNLPNRYDRMKLKADVQQFESVLPKDIKDGLIKAMSAETANEQVDALASLNLGEIKDPAIRRNVVDYISSKIKYDFAKGVAQGDQELYRIRKVDESVNSIIHDTDGVLYVASVTDNNRPDNEVYILSGNVNGDKNEPVVILDEDGSKVMTTMANVRVRNQMDAGTLREQLILAELTKQQQEQAEEEGLEKAESLGINTQEIPVVGEEVALPDGSAIKIVAVDNNGVTFDMLDPEGMTMDTKTLSFEEYSAMNGNQQPVQQTEQGNVVSEQQQAEQVQHPTVKTLTDGKTALNITLNENNEGISNEVYDNLPDAEKVVKSLSKRFSKLEFQVIDQSDEDPFTPDAFVISVKPKNIPTNEGKTESTVSAEETITPETAVNQVSQQAEEVKPEEVSYGQDIQGQQVQPEVENQEQVTGEEVRQEGAKRPSSEWAKESEYTIINPDGWDRNNFEESWNEPITKDEFDRRLSMSTVESKKNLENTPVVEVQSNDRQIEQLVNDIEGRVADVQKKADVQINSNKKKKNPNKFLPKRAIELMKSDPQSLDEAIIQHILRGGKFSRNDYIRHSGFKEGSDEVNKAAFNGLINGKDQQEGTQFDTFLGLLGNDFGKDDGIDLINSIVDVINLSTRPNLARRLIEIADASQENTPHTNDDYAQGLAEQQEALRLAEEAEINQIQQDLYSKYPEITEQEYAELFNFGENDYDEQGNEPATDGDLRGVQGENRDDGAVDNERNGQDEAGGVPGVEVDGRGEGQGSREELVENTEEDSNRVPDTKETIETPISEQQPNTTSQVDAIKSVITLMDEQEETINKLKAIASKPQKTSKDTQEQIQLEYKLGQIEEKLNKAQALVNIPAEKLNSVTKLVRESLTEEKAIDARIESLNSQKKNKEKEFNTRNGVFGDNKEIADKAKGQQSLFAGDIFEASTNTLANTIKPITDSITKLEEEKERNSKVLVDKVELELKGAQQEIKEEKQPNEEIIPEFVGQSISEDAEPLSEKDNVENDNSEVSEDEEKEGIEQAVSIKDFGEKIGMARKDVAERGFKINRSKEDSPLPAWAKKYKVFEPGTTINRRGERNTKFDVVIVNGNSFRNIASFDTKEEAEAFIPAAEAAINHRVYPSNKNRDEFSIYRRWSSGKMWEVKKGFKTKDEALKYMITDALELINYKTPRLERPHLDKVERVGAPRRTGNVTPQQFMDVFGFRGGEFGNWVAQDERQEMLNFAYDAFLDMAEVLNIPPKAVSLNGRLAIGFGSRGQGLSNASAHFEPSRTVINLTKINGAGALAHEWFHAFDSYFGFKDRITPDENGVIGVNIDTNRDYLSGDYFLGSKLRGELKEAWKKTWDAIRYKREMSTYDKSQSEKRLESSVEELMGKIKAEREWLARERSYGLRKKPATEEQLKRFDSIVEKANRFEFGNLMDKPTKKRFSYEKWYEIQRDFNEIVKEVTGGSSRLSYDDFRRVELNLDTKKKAEDGEKFERKVSTTFYTDSREIDKTRSSDYWSTNHEMAARAFESYMFDKINEAGGKNDYLVHSVSNGIYQLIYDAKPYPEGEERSAINKAFDNLFSVIKTEEKEDGNVVMFRANNPTFYANSEKALEGLSDNNRTPEQWKAELLKNGAKESELNYMGWSQFVEGKRTLTKNDLTDFVNSNKVQVEEVIKGGAVWYGNELIDNNETLANLIHNEDGTWSYESNFSEGSETYETREDAMRDAEGATVGDIYSENAPKYSSYTTPGGKNYREVLLTLPDKSNYKLSDEEIKQKAIDEGFRFDVYPNKVLMFKDGEVWDEQKDMSTVISVMRNRYKDGTIVHDKTFTSSHFNEPNIAAHVRLSEFTDKQGRRVLLVDEVQSDWAQEGKKKGFKEKQQDLPMKASELKSGDKIGQYNVVEVLDDVQQVELIDEQTGKNEWFAFKIVDKWLSDSDQSKYDNRIPDMPFKKTDQWVGLGMKWAIQYAAKNGFDGVAWTTGEQQAQRYDLSKQVDEISYNKKTKQLIIWDKNGNTLPPQYTEESELENVIGKEVSQKIIDSSEETVVLSGLDLKVGGTGMIAFYDQIIPSWVNKYAKKFGTKTTTTEIDTTPDIVEHGIDLNTGEVGKDKNYQQVHYLPISDSMVSGVTQGQPLFRSASEMLNGSESQRKFLAIQSEFNRIAELSNGAITAELVRTVDELPEVLRNNGVSEKSIKEILDAVKKGRVSGFFLMGKAYVISDNSIDEKEAVRTLIHERGLHGGIRMLIPDAETRLDFLEKVFESVGEDAFNKMVIENGGHPDQYKEQSNWQKGEEYLAFLSEKIISEKDLTPKERGVWEWLKNYINNLIAKVLRFDVNSIKFTDKELAHIVRASVNANYVTTNATSGRGRTQKETSSQENREGDRDSSVLEGTDRGDNVHDNVQYADSRRSRCVQHIKDALRKEELNNLPYNHGTFAEFKQFDFNKVGEGTGEKIHGHGLYFNITTKDKEVGKSYARMGTLYTPKGMAYMNEVGEKLGKLSQSYLNKAFLKNHGNEEREAVLNTLKGWLSTATQEKNKEALSSLVDFVENKQFPNDRYLMTGTIKTRNKEFNFLHWDDPLFKDQWDAIISRLKVEQFNENELIEKVAEKTYSYDMDGGYNYNDPTGASVYRSLSEILGGDVVASNFLRRAGIDGTMFFDKAVNDGDSRVNVCLFSDEGVEVDDTVMFRTAGEYVEGASNATKLSKTEKAQEFVQDRMYSVRKLLDVVQKRGGVVEDFSNIYVIENLAASKADAAMDAYRDNELKNVTVAVANVMNATGKNYNEITDYLIAKHTPERNEYFRSQGRTGERFAGEWTDEEAKAITDAFEQEVGDELVSSLWRSINEATDYTLNRTYQYGFINKDEYKALKKRWKFYVPLRGWKVKDEIDSIWDYANKDSERTFDGMAKAKGRTSKSDDPIAHIASMAHSMVVSGEKNMIKQSAFRLANANKDMNDLFTVKKIYQVITGKDADGNDIVTDTYEKPEQKLYDEGKVITKTNRNHNRYRSGGESKQHEVSLWINGEKAVVIFDDPNVASAINYENMFQDKVTLALQNTVGRFTRFLSTVFTSKNPAFIPINLLRDLGYSSMSHLIRDDGNFTGYAKNLAKAKKAISRKLKGKADAKNDSLDHLYEQFLKYGGETGWVHLDSIDRIKGKLQKDIRKLDKTSGFARKVLVDGIVNNAGELLDRMATVSENISRFATFLASVEQGKSYQKAAYDAKNITVNFNRKGRATGLFGSIYAFFNASIQGGNNVISMAVNNKGKFAFTAAMFYGAAILNAALHDATEDDDDETYFDNSDYVRQNNLVINIGNGEYLSLPLPHGFRSFYALGDMTYMLMKGMITEGDLVKNGLSAVISNVSPVDPVGVINKKGELDPRPIIPTFAVPFYDIATNSDFSNRRIYREAYTPKDEMFGAESQRYDKNVSPVFRAITDGLFKLGGGDPKTGLKEAWDKKGNKHTVSDLADWNPSKAEYFFTYYTGGTGKFFNDLVKFSGNVITESKEAMKNNDELSKTLLDVYTGVDFNNAPVINRLIREPRSYEFNKEYYAIMRDLNSMDFAISRYNKVGDRDIARKLKRSEVYRVADRAKEKIDRIMDRITRGNLTAEKFEEYDKEITAIKKETVEKIRKLKGNDTESGRD